MIYLRPIGGLCNRMRAIDTFYSICKKSKKDLTIIWNTDETLNCSFFELFKHPNFKEFQLHIVDCLPGFPETNLIKLGKSEDKKYRINKIKEEGFVKPNLKALLLRNKLTAKHKEIAAEIKGIPYGLVVTNENLGKLYDSKNYMNLDILEMDNLFFSKISSLLEGILTKKVNFYISNCYRLVPIEGSYESFETTDDISVKVSKIITDFSGSTVGLHIRKSDHVVSKSISTTEKFISLIDNLLNKDSETRFFLSTDDLATKEELIVKYGEKIITQTLLSYSRNEPIAIKEALVDLICLSKTTAIFGSHQSSFSQTAAHIGGIVQNTVT